MPFRDRLKRVISRRKSSGPSRSSLASTQSSTSTAVDPSDKSSPIYYQPGEKIPYKYRRPVDPEHKRQLESFTWAKTWRRKSYGSQYSPMGSRMPSRQGSGAGPDTAALKLRNSIDRQGVANPASNLKGGATSAYENTGPTQLTPIESVPITRMEPSEPTEGSAAAFTQQELDAALLKKANVAEAAA